MRNSDYGINSRTDIPVCHLIPVGQASLLVYERMKAEG